MQWLLLTLSLDIDHKYLAWWARFSCCCQSPLGWPSWVGAIVVIFLTLWLCFFTWVCSLSTSACEHFPRPSFMPLPLFPKNMLLPTHPVYDFWAENRFTPSLLSPCSDPKSDFAASHFFISSWPLVIFSRPYFLQLREPFFACQGGLSFITVRT